MKKANILVSVFFFVLIFALTVASMINPVREKSETENRDLAQMPELSVENIFDGSFTRDYESFVTDQFVWRDAWINMKSQFERMFGRTHANGVYFAKDGYFIERKSENDVDVKQLDENTGYLEKLALELEKLELQGAVITLAPIASMVHDDKLPVFADEYDWDNKMDEISEKLGDTFVDLRAALRAHRDEYIYYRTDHHWTTDGAYYAYAELIKSFGFEPLPLERFERTELTDEFLGTVIAKLNISTKPDVMVRYDTIPSQKYEVIYNLTDKRDTFYNPEKLKIRDKYAYFMDGNPAFVEIGTEVANGRTLAIAKDSYANCLIPFLTNHFEKIYVFDLRYFNGGFVSFSKQLGDVTDMLVLHNISGFANEKTIVRLPK